METKVILIRLFSGLLLSGLIGFEREKNNSAAGLKTHTLVGVASTILAILEDSIVMQSIARAQMYPELAELFGHDPSRIIAQVVSGIGFLGAGTIIVTKRHVAGLTTAASIWAVAALGITIGKGQFVLAFAGFVSIFIILVVVKYFMRVTSDTYLLIKHLNKDSINYVKKVLEENNYEGYVNRFKAEIIETTKLYSTVFEIENIKRNQVQVIMEKLLENEDIISCERTSLEI